MTMIEKMARAIAKSDGMTWEKFGAAGMDNYTRRAKAALTVLLEPDEAMLKASPIVGTGMDETGRWCTNTEPARACFTATILAALTPEPADKA